MSKPTGKLKFAYQSIANLEATVERQRVEISDLKASLAVVSKALAKKPSDYSIKSDIVMPIESRPDSVCVPLDVIRAVAHIGVDFGYGPYEVEDKHIKAAQEYLAHTEQENEG